MSLLLMPPWLHRAILARSSLTKSVLASSDFQRRKNIYLLQTLINKREIFTLTALNSRLFALS